MKRDEKKHIVNQNEPENFADCFERVENHVRNKYHQRPSPWGVAKTHRGFEAQVFYGLIYLEFALAIVYQNIMLRKRNLDASKITESSAVEKCVASIKGEGALLSMKRKETQSERNPELIRLR